MLALPKPTNLRPMSTPSSNAALSSTVPSNGAKESVPSPSLGTAASSWATVVSRSAKNKLRRRAAAARGFQPVSGEQGFDSSSSLSSWCG
ncbi:hypothetical protein G6F35_017965 [Rhizopus arrhizus]|nr:hypothetical protein G6F35_017965 [Rhizopus arrhizus]